MESIRFFFDSLSDIDILIQHAKRNISSVSKYQLFNKIAIILLLTKFEVFVENFIEEHIERMLNGHTYETFPSQLKEFYIDTAADLIRTNNKYKNKLHYLNEINLLFGNSGDKLSKITDIRPSSKFNYGKHGQTEITNLFVKHGLQKFITDATIIDLLKQINSCVNIRNNIIHQDATPSLTHQDVDSYKKVIESFVKKLEVEIKANVNAYYNE